MHEILDRAIKSMRFNREIERAPGPEQRDASNMAAIGLAEFIEREIRDQAQGQLGLDQE